MMIHDFHIMSIAFFPFKIDASLIIDPDAVLLFSGPVSRQFLSVFGRREKLISGL